MRILGERNEECAPLLTSLTRLIGSNMREKPSFSEAWLIGPGLGEEVEHYEIAGAKVSIRNSADGQVDYVIIPDEYRLERQDSALLRRVIDIVSSQPPPLGVLPDRSYMRSRAREALNSMGSQSLRESPRTLADEERICSLAVRYTVGYGILETLLEDPHIEDVYVDAPCDRNRVHVTVNGVSGFNSVVRCRSNIMLEQVEMDHVLSRLCRVSGLPFSETHPTLECDMGFKGARATAVGRPLSPAGTALALRRHSSIPWTLTRMMVNGTLSAETAALISLMVDGRSTMMICGPRGAGKSSLLSACLFEFPLSQRVLTLEDTRELPVDVMQAMGYKVQSILADDRNGESNERSREALRLSLRMGESALVMGEVRGEEVSMLYEGMRTGRAGSTVMGTMHGESAVSLYERVVHDLGVSPEAFMATDAVISLGLNRPRGSQRMRRGVREISEIGEVPGEFRPLMVNGDWAPDIINSRTLSRIASAWDMTKDQVMDNLRIRRDMRSFLEDMGREDGESLNPNWTRLANDHLSACMAEGDLDPHEVVDSFKDLYRRRRGID